MRKSLIDAGPLIALFDGDDNHHGRVNNFLKSYRGRLVTSWPVITETLHMLDFDVRVQVDFLKWIQHDALDIIPLTKEHLSRIIALTSKYADVPMEFADASLIVISELEYIKEIITIDSGFHIYRNLRREMLKNLLDS